MLIFIIMCIGCVFVQEIRKYVIELLFNGTFFLSDYVLVLSPTSLIQMQKKSSV